jgi:SAM-dependent methyltransferase
MNDDATKSIDAWTGYWRTGIGASCFDGPNIEVRLAMIWDEFVDDLPDGARLLDLATGNGTVARICAARARLRKIRLQIDAVDAARIDPPKFAADPARLFADIRFQGEVRLEALPFAGASIDAAVSQFGFEYADEEAAVAEVSRVLAPAGRLRLVMHARDGAVSRDIGGRLDRLRTVLDQRGPVALVRALVRALEAGDMGAVSRESTHLAAAAELLRKIAHQAPRDDAAVFYSSEFLRSWERRDRCRVSDLRRSVEDGWANAAGVAARQEQMLRAARTFDDVRSLASRLATAGLLVDPPREIRDERRSVQIAWLVTARTPGRA